MGVDVADLVGRECRVVEGRLAAPARGFPPWGRDPTRRRVRRHAVPGERLPRGPPRGRGRASSSSSTIIAPASPITNPSPLGVEGSRGRPAGRRCDVRSRAWRRTRRCRRATPAPRCRRRSSRPRARAGSRRGRRRAPCSRRRTRCTRREAGPSCRAHRDPACREVRDDLDDRERVDPVGAAVVEHLDAGLERLEPADPGGDGCADPVGLARDVDARVGLRLPAAASARWVKRSMRREAL